MKREIRLNDRINKAFEVSTTVCTLCNGSKQVRLKDGDYGHCVCVIRENFIKYLGFLRKYISYDKTPLVKYVGKEQSIVIRYPEINTLYAHVKTALVKYRKLKYAWLSLTPDQVLSYMFDGDSKDLIYGVDLLIINAPTFPQYEAAGKHHEYVISTREALGKTTWICITKSVDEFNTGIGVTEGMKQLIKRLPLVPLTKGNPVKPKGTEGLVRTSPATDPKVDVSAMSIGHKSDKRINDLMSGKVDSEEESLD